MEAKQFGEVTSKGQNRSLPHEPFNVPNDLRGSNGQPFVCGVVLQMTWGKEQGHHLPGHIHLPASSTNSLLL